ncbi:hypothetical protein AMTR_s00046p00222380 [Amborella trichopoda]|uniref:Uncharacterized protein n=1 Tax=Amborella trichopoda TaxID=13333 RepID=U5D788_AMBTC|nr:hypothetical protein AMTR_s00046p00222380 [Amborella trichopoda]
MNTLSWACPRTIIEETQIVDKKPPDDQGMPRGLVTKIRPKGHGDPNAAMCGKVFWSNMCLKKGGGGAGATMSNMSIPTQSFTGPDKGIEEEQSKHEVLPIRYYLERAG